MFCGQILRLITFFIFSLVVILVSEERALHIEHKIKVTVYTFNDIHDTLSTFVFKKKVN